MEQRYTKAFCVENNIIIECENGKQACLVYKNPVYTKNFIKHNTIIYIVLRKNEGFVWMHTKESKYIDYFKKNGYNYTETISAQRYFQDNGISYYTPILSYYY